MVTSFHCSSGWLGAARHLGNHPQESSNLVLFSPEKMVQLLLRIESLRCVNFGVLVSILLFILITFSSRVTGFALRVLHVLPITSPILVPTLGLGSECQ